MSNHFKNYEGRRRPLLQFVIIEVHIPWIIKTKTYMLAKYGPCHALAVVSETLVQCQSSGSGHVNRAGPKIETT